MSPRPWLGEIPCELVVWQNSQLCAAKRAHHGPTSDGHEACRALWEKEHPKELSLEEMVDLCRRCHRMAPFTNYNGNTFAAIARTIIDQLDLAAPEAALIRSLAGHIVAGVAGEEEVHAFREFCETFD